MAKKVPSIGAGVITTDDVIAQGYDYVPLYQAGMLKVPAATVDGDLSVGAGAAYAKPAALALTTDLAATKSVAVGAALAFAIAVTGGVAPYQIEWFKNDAVIQSNGSLNLNLGNATLAMAGRYYAKVTDQAGKEITSTEQTVTVTPAEGGE